MNAIKTMSGAARKRARKEVSAALQKAVDLGAGAGQTNHSEFRAVERVLRLTGSAMAVGAAVPNQLKSVVDVLDRMKNGERVQEFVLPVPHAAVPEVHETEMDGLDWQRLLPEYNRKKMVVLIIDELPGVYVLREAVPEALQKQLYSESFEKYAKLPFVTNLDLHYEVPECGIYSLYKKWQQSGEDMFLNPRIHSVDGPTLIEYNSTEPDQEPDLDSKQEPKSRKYRVTIDRPADEMSDKRPVKIENAFLRLRWANLGVPYEWSRKEYRHVNDYAPVPSLLQDISRAVVDGLRGLVGFSDEWKADAAVVNFYREGDALMGHVDRSELCDAPLVTVSVGGGCVFVLGSGRPSAIVLQSGDVVVMSGEGRRMMHGVSLVVGERISFSIRKVF